MYLFVYLFHTQEFLLDFIPRTHSLWNHWFCPFSAWIYSGKSAFLLSRLLHHVFPLFQILMVTHREKNFLTSKEHIFPIF